MKYIIGLLIWSVQTMAVLPMANYPIHNSDGLTFKNPEGLNLIKLDFQKKGFTQNDKFTAFDVSYMERGNFYYITHKHALWVLKEIVDIPKNWEGKDGVLSAKTPAVILFTDGKKNYTLTYGDLKFKNQRIEKSEKWGNYTQWYAKSEVFVPQHGPGKRTTGAFIPRLKLWDLDDGSAIEIQIMTGLISPLPAEKEAPIYDSQPATTPPPVSNAAPNSMEIVQWYQQEAKKLNEKAGSMSDKELNQAMEKLTADYNRKLLALIAAMPDLSGQNQATTSKSENPQQVSFQHGGTLINFDIPKDYEVTKVEQRNFNNYEVFLSDGASIKINISKSKTKPSETMKITSGISFEITPPQDGPEFEQINFTLVAVKTSVDAFAKLVSKTISLIALPNSKGHS